MTTEMHPTDAERLQAAGGHQVGDCDECGQFHTAWSVHFNADGSEREPSWIRKERELIVQYADRISAAHATAKGPWFPDYDDDDDDPGSDETNKPGDRLRNVRGTLEMLLSYIGES